MPQTEPAQVFISYSHKDEKPFLNEFRDHLKPFVRLGISVWSDRHIIPGSLWLDEIKTALASAKIAVLMVSPAFLASDIIHAHELMPLLKNAAQAGVHILWIPVRACSYEVTPLKDYQAVLSPDKPLAEMKAQRDKAWVTICKVIQKMLLPFSGPALGLRPVPGTQSTLSQSSLPGLPGHSTQDPAIEALGGSPMSPIGQMLYGKG